MTGLIPVTEDNDDRKWKFQMFHIKTAISYFIWFVIPTACITGQIIVTSLSNQTWEQFFGFNIYNLAIHSQSFLPCAIYLVIPGLLANLVEKSMIDLDTNTEFKDHIYTIISGIFYVTLNGILFIYLLQVLPFNVTLAITLSISIILILTFEMDCLLLVLHNVSKDFERKFFEAGKIVQIERFAALHIELVKRFRGIKQGFSPILFILTMLLGLTALVMFYSVKSYLAVNTLLVVFYIINGICQLAILYYVASLCDATYNILSSNNDKLRLVQLLDIFKLCCYLLFKSTDLNKFNNIEMG